ncbi:hypothetical protein KKG46_01465 [Patescibacteria group bacterium]|nr:hypothetical protein [Patescibacteria group bacterium]
MPVKSKPRTKKAGTVKKISRTPKKIPRDYTLMHCQTTKTFWIVFSFLLLFVGMIVMSAILFLFYQEQTSLTNNFRNMQASIAAQEQQGSSERLSAFKYINTDVSGLFLAYTPCPSTFTGSCDDAMLFRQSADGTKQVIIKSLRSLKDSPNTTDILQPVFESSDHKWLVLGAWTFGGKRNTADSRVWIYNQDLGDIAYKSDMVPAGATFSVNYNLAAFAVDDGQIDEIKVVDIQKNEVLSQIKAGVGRTFTSPQNFLTMYWEADNVLVIKEYSLPTAEQPTSIEKGERRIKF